MAVKPRTGNLVKMTKRSVKKDASAVSVYSTATNEKNKVRYGFVLAAWGKVDLKPIADSYENSDAMSKTIDKALQKELTKIVGN